MPSVTAVDEAMPNINLLLTRKNAPDDPTVMVVVSNHNDTTFAFGDLPSCFRRVWAVRLAFFRSIYAPEANIYGSPLIE